MPRLQPRPEGAEEGGDYFVDLKEHAVSPTEEGIDKIERLLKVDNLFDRRPAPGAPLRAGAASAHALYQRDRDYIVKDGEIVIVDEFTGRQMPGRRWSEGLHQAIEAKEGLRVQRESVTLATITFQNYFRLYDKLSGMTGTAMTEQEEFYKIYGLEVVAIPTHRPMIRDDDADLVFRTENAKFEALIDEIVEMTEAGRPVLVGTTSVEKSEVLSEMLKRRGIKHEVLNAKFHEKEAPIVAQAGRSGAVTIATNMAGRGTDILLGGNPAGPGLGRAAQAGHQPGRGAARGVRGRARQGQGATPPRTTSAWSAAGGLHIIGTERHEARRIDNQLRGRAGRQGDPGSSRFYLSLEDTLMKRFASDRVAGPDGAHGPARATWRIESRLVSQDDRERPVPRRGLQLRHPQARRRVRRRHQQAARDDLRRARQGPAQRGPDRRPCATSSTRRSGRSSRSHLGPSRSTTGTSTGWPRRSRSSASTAPASTADDAGRARRRARRSSSTCSDGGRRRRSRQREQQYGPDVWAQVERLVLLRSIDTLWVEHLTELDDMRRGIGLRGYGGMDPLNEFKREAFKLYEELRGFIRRQVASTIFRVNIQPRRQAAGCGRAVPRPPVPVSRDRHDERPAMAADVNAGARQRRCW